MRTYRATDTFELYGCEELAGKIEELLSIYPAETTAEMEKITNDFKKDVNAKFPQQGKGTSRPVAKNWKKYKMKSLQGYTIGVEMQNSAPHFHLVEHGHEQYVSKEMYAALQNGNLKFGKKNRESKDYKKQKANGTVHMGFTAGKHYCEKTRNQWNNGEFADRCEKHVKKLLKKVDLT